MVCAEVKIANLELNALFQCVVFHARRISSSKQFTVLYTAGFVQPEDFVGCCMLITADEITSISYEQWLLEQAEDKPRLNDATAA